MKLLSKVILDSERNVQSLKGRETLPGPRSFYVTTSKTTRSEKELEEHGSRRREKNNSYTYKTLTWTKRSCREEESHHKNIMFDVTSDVTALSEVQIYGLQS